MIKYTLTLMSIEEFITSICDDCIFEGCCCSSVRFDCNNAITNRFNEIMHRTNFNDLVLYGLH